MEDRNYLVNKLQQFISLTDSQTHEEIAAYIVGELIGDSTGRYRDLKEDPVIARISDLASDLEWSNGSPEQLDEMWAELEQKIKSL